MEITTVEGLGSTRTQMHPVQQRLADMHGTQCGFCTPGMVMAMNGYTTAAVKKIYKTGPFFNFLLS